MIRPLSLLAASVAVFGLGSLAQAASLIPIYDGTSLPQAQGWLYATQAPPPATIPTPWPAASQTFLNPGVNTNTTADIAGLSGYFRQLAPGTLDRTQGYQVSTTVRLLSSTSGRADRSGLHVLVLSSDKFGVEVGVSPDGFFALQADANNTTLVLAESVTVGSGVNLNTDLVLDVRVFASTYALHVNGANTPVLTGPLRNLSAVLTRFGPMYNNADAVFLGDNTGSASSNYNWLGGSVIPEPSALGLLLPAGLVLRRRR